MDYEFIGEIVCVCVCELLNYRMKDYAENLPSGLVKLTSLRVTSLGSDNLTVSCLDVVAESCGLMIS